MWQFRWADLRQFYKFPTPNFCPGCREPHQETPDGGRNEGLLCPLNKRYSTQNIPDLSKALSITSSYYACFYLLSSSLSILMYFFISKYVFVFQVMMVYQAIAPALSFLFWWKYTDHKIHHFNHVGVYNLVAVSTFTVLWNHHHYPSSEVFSLTQTEVVYSFNNNLSFPLSPLP